MEVRTDIEARLRAIETRIDAACQRAGRARSEVTLVGASKVQPPAALEAAFAAGLRVFGENRVQEAEAKAPGLPAAIDWHLIGPLQSNKARRAVDIFSTIHSIDRLKVARVVERVAGEAGVERTGLLEINLAGEASKHGFAPEALTAQCQAELAALEHLQIVGLMAIPPVGESAEDSRPWFRRLRQLRDAISEGDELPHWRGALSMGMSQDFEVAIEEGATYVRVGTELFGPRRFDGGGA
jgi:pyridoxal phosphate enzyme (YggS family)